MAVRKLLAVTGLVAWLGVVWQIQPSSPWSRRRTSVTTTRVSREVTAPSVRRGLLHRFAVEVAALASDLERLVVRGRGAGGPEQREASPLADHALHLDDGAMRLRQALHQRQSHAGATELAGGAVVDLVEALEDARDGLGGDADAVVDDVQGQLFGAAVGDSMDTNIAALGVGLRCIFDPGPQHPLKAVDG